MNQYHLSDESSLYSEMQLHEFSGNRTLDCSDAFSHDLCPDMREMIFSGLNNLEVDLSLSSANINNDSLEDNLDNLSSLYSVKDCDSAKLLEDCDSDSRPLLHELGLPVPSAPKEVEQGGRSSSGSGKKGKHPQSSLQAPFLDCSLCGKVFSSTSSLSKHYVTHSQERKHVCKICSKAFKRQDHLSGHMLTHQKTKPFICIEQGCNKSYSDHRSLRRHYEMHHGLRLLKDDEACEGCTPPHDSRAQMGPSSVRTAERLAVYPEPPASNNSLLPNRDLLRCIVSSLVSQKLPSAPSPNTGQSEPSSKSSLQPCTSACGPVSCIPTNTTVLTEATGDKVMKELYPCQKTTASSSVYTIINPGNLSVLGPAENVSNLPDRQQQSEPQFPLETTALEYWPNSSIPRYPFFRGQKIPAASHQSSGNFQWVRNVSPSCTKSKGNSVFVAQMSPVATQDISQGLAGPSHAFDSLAQTFEHPDVLSFTPALLKTQGELPGESKLSGFEETFRPSARLPDAPKHSVLRKDEAGPLFRQLFMTSQESSVNQDQLQVQGHLFQRITKSQHIVSHTQLVAPSQPVTTEAKQAVAKPVRSVFQQQTDVTHPLLEPTESEVSPFCSEKALTIFQKDFSSGTEKERQQPPSPQSFQSLSAPPVNTDTVFHAKHTRLLKGNLGFKDYFSPSQSIAYENTPGNHTYGKPSQLEDSSPISRKKEKSKACVKELSSKGHSRSGRPRRKEKLKFDVSSVASPSQVAMASFSLPTTSLESRARGKPKLTIFNKIQGRNIYSFTGAMKEEPFSLGCSKTGEGPGDRSEQGNGFVCTTCRQLFYTERGLNSHMCFYSEEWQSPSGKEKLQADHLQPQKLSFKPAGDGDTPPEIKRPLEDVAVAPLVIPVSVPVTATNQQQESKVEEKEHPDDNDPQENIPQKKRKRRTHPKSLFIPPPPPVCSEIQPGTGGCYQSNLRSPVFLMDHLLQGLVQCSPYTPPPMLSPIREGSGLYFNTLCSSSTNAGSTKMYTSVLDGMDGALLFSLVKDTTKISIEPHINIGSRFQAEIPDLQDSSSLENYEHPASLVWKPWGDITTNKETQKRVTDLLKLACSSAMPGGGTNLELAVHCLHEAQGNILEALEMLLLQGPQKPPCHPLTNYHYPGAHLWTPAEKQLFRKAFGFHKKDFYLIQKKTACSPKKRHCHLPKQENKLKPRNSKKTTQSTFSLTSNSQKETIDRPGSTGSEGVFPCKECARVFDKIKSRNAHMKRHRLQEQMEPMIKIKWPMKNLKNEPKKEERNSDVNFLQW
ncbi:zinc finger protein 541 isoform X2 [Tiliqua scincoides]|uniref:zinc finger protein 541 isoform X2 n=1 Tax=Tiliqua scincoides TaxID=71010 RepID=UPI0034629C46